jgi:hypothetical protein
LDARVSSLNIEYLAAARGAAPLRLVAAACTAKDIFLQVLTTCPEPASFRHARSVPMSMNETTRHKLAAVSTATLTTVLFKRGFRNTFIQGIHRINPAAPAMTSTTSACSRIAAIRSARASRNARRAMSS